MNQTSDFESIKLPNHYRACDQMGSKGPNDDGASSMQGAAVFAGIALAISVGCFLSHHLIAGTLSAWLAIAGAIDSLSSLWMARALKSLGWSALKKRVKAFNQKVEAFHSIATDVEGYTGNLEATEVKLRLERQQLAEELSALQTSLDGIIAERERPANERARKRRLRQAAAQLEIGMQETSPSLTADLTLPTMAAIARLEADENK